jgi:hypothetical protein
VTVKGKCRACPAEMIWAQMVEVENHEPKLTSGGKPVLNPLDVDPLDPATVTALTHAVAYNPHNAHGIMVTEANIALVPGWAEAGATFHLSHFATCPERGRFKRDA